MKRDTRIFDLIAAERSRQTHGIELIASENFVSDQVMEAMGSVLTNKYAEGYPAARYYGGCEVVDQVESLAIERVCQLYGAEYANVQPHSGAQANMAVFFACLQPGDTFMGLDLAHGGHLSHGSPVNMSGKYFKAVGYKLDEATGTIDYDAMERLAEECRPKLIVGGACWRPPSSTPTSSPRPRTRPCAARAAASSSWARTSRTRGASPRPRAPSR